MQVLFHTVITMVNVYELDRKLHDIDSIYIEKRHLLRRHCRKARDVCQTELTPHAVYNNNGRDYGIAFSGERVDVAIPVFLAQIESLFK